MPPDTSAARFQVTLQNPARVFGKDQATMFEMDKPLAQHLK